MLKSFPSRPFPNLQDMIEARILDEEPSPRGQKLQKTRDAVSSPVNCGTKVGKLIDYDEPSKDLIRLDSFSTLPVLPVGCASKETVGKSPWSICERKTKASPKKTCDAPSEIMLFRNLNLHNTDSDIEKDSDESDFSEDDVPHGEESPLDEGWEDALIISSVKDVNSGNYHVQMFNNKRYFFGMLVEPEYAEALAKTTYARFKCVNGGPSNKVYPSNHRHCQLGNLKFRPNKSLEMKPIGVVAFSRDPCAPSQVWSDEAGWIQIDHRHFGVFRKGLVDIDKNDVFKPLGLIEFTVRYRHDIPQEQITSHPDGIRISEIGPLCANSPDDPDLPAYYVPKCPRRIYNLKYKESRRAPDTRLYFEADSRKDLIFWASPDQCAISGVDKQYPLGGVFVPVEEKTYRALIVAPLQVLSFLTKNHHMNFKMFPPKREYASIQDPNISKVKEVLAKVSSERGIYNYF